MDSGLSDFAFKVLHPLVTSENENENLLYSPLVLISSLLLLLYGSRGPSSVQIARILFLSSVNSPAKHTLNTTTNSILHLRNLMTKVFINQVNGTTTNANFTSLRVNEPNSWATLKSEIFAPHSLSISQEFQVISRELFNFDTNFFDSSSSNNNLLSVASKKLLNYTALATARARHLGRFSDNQLRFVLGQLKLTERQLLMVNLMKMKINFEKTFIPIGRKKFYTSNHDNQWLHVPFVSVENLIDVGYSEKLNCTLVTLPLTRHKLHFVIILPDEKISLDQVTSKVQSQPDDLYMNLKYNYTRKPVHLTMPFINLTWTGTFKDQLKSIGIKGVFQQGLANLVNLSPVPLAVNVGQIVQSNYLSMDSSLSSNDDSVPQVESTSLIENVTVDRPFLFLVASMHRRKIGDVILMGTFRQPQFV